MRPASLTFALIIGALVPIVRARADETDCGKNRSHGYLHAQYALVNNDEYTDELFIGGKLIEFGDQPGHASVASMDDNNDYFVTVYGNSHRETQYVFSEEEKALNIYSARD